MKLLYTSTAYPPSTGGAQFYAHSLVKQLKKRHDVQVITFWDEHRTDWLLGTTLRARKQDRDYTIDGVLVHRLGLSNWEKMRLLPSVLMYYPLMGVALKPISKALTAQILKYTAQVDLIHNVRIGREGISYASMQTARQLDIPFVFTPLHHPRWVGWPYLEYLKLYSLADRVFTLTDTEKKILVALGVNEKRIVVTGMGPILAPEAWPEVFLEKNAIDGPMILFLGQHYRYKGYFQLLEAAKIVWKKVPEAHFVFIGPPVKGSEEDFKVFRDVRLHRLGKVDLQTKTNALAACTLLCVPSTQESFGGVYTEAWSFAKPVIGCNIPAVSEVIDDEVNGFLVKQEPEQIADRILALILNPQNATEMGLNGQSKVNAKYTWEKLAKLTEQAYREAITG